MAGPFADLRVLDIAEGIGGPMAAWLFAELGADVLKVEPLQGDRLRGSPAFHVLNRSKRGVAIDLTASAGQARLAPLLRAADVAVVGGAPSSYATRGLDAERLRTLNDQLIVVQVPSYGSRGPLQDLPEDETLLAALSGLLSLQWSYRPGPVALTIPVAGYAHGLMTANAIAAALLAREAVGVGQVVECSGLGGAYAFESGSFVFGEEVSIIATSGDPKGRVPPYGLYQAADGRWLFIACLTEAFWVKLALALGLDDLLADPALQDGPLAMGDPAVAPRVRARLEAAFRSKPRDAWLQLLDAADVPCGPVQSRQDFMAEPQVRHMDMVATVEDPELGPTRQMGVPLTLSATPGAIRSGAPPLDPTAAPPAWEQRPPRRRQGSRRSPLEGTVVLDLATFIAGSYAPMMLADLGATVIKIEPHSGDPFRQFGLGFQGWNRGKRSLALDLKSEQGRQTLYRLVQQADVVVENYRAGVAERLQIDYDTLSSINPRLVMVSVTANGPTGPLRHQPGYDPILQARSGAAQQQGGGEHAEPVYFQIATADYCSAAVAACGAMAALYARGPTGRGQRVETSLLQNAMTAQAGQFIFYEGRPPDPPGGPDLLGWSAINRAYPCRGDGWIFIHLTHDRHWQALATRLKQHDWLTRWDFAAARSQPVEGALAARIAAEMRVWERDRLLDRLVAAGLPCAPCLSLEEIFTHPHIAANELAWQTVHLDFGPVRQTGAFARFSETPMHLQRPAPTIGQDSEAVLSEFGFTGGEISALIAAGAVTQANPDHPALGAESSTHASPSTSVRQRARRQPED